MRLESLRMVGGSCAVYAIVAACSAGGGHPGNKGAGTMARAGTSSGPSGGSGTDATGGMAVDGAGGTSGGHSGSGGAAIAGQFAGGNDQGGLGGIMDPVPSAMADPRDGTRLKARYLVGEDGSRQWNFGWYDSLREENCQFGAASDGVTRCLPTLSGAAASAPGTGYFADADCSQPLVVVGSTCSTPKAPKSAYRLAAACAASFDFFDVGAKYDGATIYLKSGASCLSQALPAGITFYALGAAIPASSFVAATEQVDQ